SWLLTAAAGLQPGPVVAAAAAAPRPAPEAQRDRPAARRAGRGQHAAGAGGQQRLDERVDAPRAVRAPAGEQPGTPLQLPQPPAALERLRDRGPDHLEQPGPVRPAAEAADMGRDLRDGIGAVVGTAAGAAWPAVPVPRGDLPGVPADRARLSGASPA